MSDRKRALQVLISAGLCALCAFSSIGEASDGTPALQARFRRVQRRAQRLSRRFGHAIDPLRIVDVAARRFVNRPDWERFVQGGGSDPRLVYDPRPATWDNWQRVTEQEVQRAAADGSPLTRQMLLAWNGDAILNTVPDFVHGGELKTTPNFGKNVTRATALAPTEVQALLDIRFDGETEPALGWVQLACEEDLPRAIPLPGALPDCQRIWSSAQQYASSSTFWADTQAQMARGEYQDRWYWYACWPRATVPAAPGAGVCGMVVYPDPSGVPARLDHLIDRVNSYFAAGATDTDPLDFALAVQRQLVAMHPFNKGNGRVSRWVMDYVAARTGLPPILVRNMDYDLSTPAETYLREGRAGASEALDRMSACLDRYERRGYEAVQGTVCGLLGDES